MSNPREHDLDRDGLQEVPADDDVDRADVREREDLDPDDQVSLPDQSGQEDADLGLREDDGRDPIDNPHVDEIRPPGERRRV